MSTAPVVAWSVRCSRGLNNLARAQLTVTAYSASQPSVSSAKRELDFLPGVAAALLVLAEFHEEHGKKDEARRQLEEARIVATVCGARSVLTDVEELAGQL